MSFEQIAERMRPNLLLALRTTGALILISLIAIPLKACLGLDRGTTNHDYLVELIDRKTLDQTAKAVVSDALAQTSQEKQHVEDLRTHAAQCLTDQATTYLNSGDPYLSQQADRDTPTILALRFMTACGLR